MKNQSIVLLIVLAFVFNLTYGQHKNSVERKVDSVLSMMTLYEKIGQMNQYNGSWDVTGPASTKDSKEKEKRLKNGGVGSMLNVLSVKATREVQKTVMENSRLKIPLLIGYDVIHGYKTIFPIPLGESASWDLDLIKRSAAVAASEASAAGVHWTFAPMIDVSRDARWGRVMEGSGEDPYLTAMIGVARVEGLQGEDLSKNNTIAACAKHFAGYGFAESGKDYNTVNVGEYELHNAILPPFKAVAEAGVATFMNSFNEIDGIPATGDKELQREILKGNWNWDGFVVSDWGSIGEMIAHGYARDKKHAAELAANAGSDMDMESYAYEAYLEQLVKEGKVDVKLIDDAVRRILRVKFRLGLFDDPYRYCNEDREQNEIYSKKNQDFAREVAKRSIVLLKNQTNLLPLDKNIRNIAVIGPLADDKDTPIGNWRAKGGRNTAVSLLEGIKNRAPVTTKITYAKGCDIVTNKEIGRTFLLPLKFNNTDRSGFKEAVEIAKKADVVILAIGEMALQTGEGRSQTDIGFAGVQQDLLEAIYKVNKNIVITLMNGRPMEITWAAENIPAILECWHLGSQSGNAIADVLFGDYNPSGKLPVSFPYHVGQEPLYYNHKNTGRPYSPIHVTYSGYADSPKTALYPFGYGLSYTRFEYKNLKLNKASIPVNGELKVSVEVANTGNHDGEEVVQLYIRDLVGSITRPVRELKGFEKIFLKKGETRTVTFTIDKEKLQFYTAKKRWEVEPGKFDVWIGGDSRAKLKQSFTVTEDKTKTKIIAHRGMSGYYPENTLLSFQKAIEIGADFFELDVHQTKDRELVVIHDKTVDRTSSNKKKGAVKDMDFKKLRKVRVGDPAKFDQRFNNEKIPTLKEALEIAKGKIKVCVELKADGIEGQVVELLKELNMTDQVIVFAFNDKSLERIKKKDPSIKTLLLRNYANIKTLDLVQKIKADAIGVGYDTQLNDEFITAAHNKGIKVFKWTVNEDGQMKKLNNLGVDGIITNYPDKALKLLNEKN